MNQCEYSERLSAYLDGELPDERRSELEQHLAGCRQCAAELETLRQMSGMLRAWDGPQLSPMAMRRLHQAVDRESFGRLRRLALSLSSLAASLALATMIFAYHGQSSAPPDAWERIAITPAAPRQDELAVGNAEEVATAQWVVADLAFGSAD